VDLEIDPLEVQITFSDLENPLNKRIEEQIFSEVSLGRDLRENKLLIKLTTHEWKLLFVGQSHRKAGRGVYAY
jgi:hypothetical protein